MSFPTAFFLDTSVLDGQQYNFTSIAFTSFVPVAREKKLLFLLPDPTKREVMRHITERSAAALAALESARRRAPFLSKWKHFPKPPENKWSTNWEVKRVATEEWESFVKQFPVKELAYEAVVLNTVMNWYDTARPPFASGKKQKEFPDAFAISALAGYAEKTKTYVAVVAEDQDFKGACEFFPYLLYFPSLPALTELLLADEKTIERVRELVLNHQNMLEDAAVETGSSLSFYISSDIEIDDTSIGPVAIDEVRVVGLGDRECTISFEGTLSYEARLKRAERQRRYRHGYGYDEDDKYYDFRPSRTSVDGEESISGTAKLRMSSDGKVIEKVTFIELDNAEIEIPEPRQW